MTKEQYNEIMEFLEDEIKDLRELHNKYGFSSYIKGKLSGMLKAKNLMERVMEDNA